MLIIKIFYYLHVYCINLKNMPILGCLNEYLGRLAHFIVQYPCFGLHTMKLYQIHSIFASALLKA